MAARRLVSHRSAGLAQDHQQRHVRQGDRQPLDIVSHVGERESDAVEIALHCEPGCVRVHRNPDQVPDDCDPGVKAVRSGRAEDSEFEQAHADEHHAPHVAIHIPSWVQDYALFLLDVGGRIVTWYSGAQRIYGYKTDEATGQHVSFLYPSEEVVRVNFEEKLKRAAAEGHLGNEGWHLRKDGSRFWANVITMALRDENGELQGFARVVRDFSERHEKDEKLRRSRARRRPVPSESTVAGIVSGEFDQVPEANDAFLEMVGYSRED